MAKILVVDDDFSCAGLLRLFLNDISHKAEMARTTEQAIELGSWFEPDVLITDWHLNHDTTGLQVAEALRSGHPQLKVVIVTGGSVDDIVSRVSHIPNVTIITKPISLEAVSSAVET